MQNDSIMLLIEVAMNQKNIDKLVKEALAIEQEEADRAGMIGYMSRALIQATMPHSKVNGNEFKRHNGMFKLVILADSDIGIPYGSMPRLLLSWITTEAVKTKSRELILGDSLSMFMRKLDLVPTGGRWGTIPRLKDQMKRLFAAAISCTYDDGENWGIRNVTPVERAELWWDPKRPHQAAMWESKLQLGESFFNEIVNSPVPINMQALKALKGSPMALDIYCWLTYRMSYLRKITPIPWVALQAQFGADYKDLRQFRRRFNDQLKKVMVIYPEVKVQGDQNNLTLYPSKPHIQKQVKIYLNEGGHKPIIQTDSQKVKESLEKERNAEYTEYKLNEAVNIIDNLKDEQEKHSLLKEFDTYLVRKRMFNVRDQIIKGIHTKEVKETLYNFLNNYRHHLLGTIKTYSEYYESDK